MKAKQVLDESSWLMSPLSQTGNGEWSNMFSNYFVLTFSGYKLED